MPTELILAFIALKAGLIEVVKATITGSILSNLLLVMGFSMLLGGFRYKEQDFQVTPALVNNSLMNLAVIALLLPTAVEYTSSGIEPAVLQKLSIAIRHNLDFCLYPHFVIFDENSRLSLRCRYGRNGRK